MWGEAGPALCPRGVNWERSGPAAPAALANTTAAGSSPSRGWKSMVKGPWGGFLRRPVSLAIFPACLHRALPLRAAVHGDTRHFGFGAPELPHFNLITPSEVLTVRT